MKRLITILTMLYSLSLCAQDVMVTVTPVQQVLPPQALLYVDNPGKFFNVAITNISSQVQQVYLNMQIDMMSPSASNMLVTPHSSLPSQPIIINANSTVQLGFMEMKRLFNHVSPNEIRTRSDIFSGYGRGSYGLFPEGRYQVQFTAYKWKYPQLANPVVVSNPTTGRATFYVSYNAHAPQFLTPVVHRNVDKDIPVVESMNAQFTWKESVVNGFPLKVRYYYTFRVVEVLDGQPLDYAMEHNPILYQAKNLMAPVCNIPPHYIRDRFSASKKYAAQVTTTTMLNSKMDFVLLENEGKSDILPFKVLPIEQVNAIPADTLMDKEIIESIAGGLTDEMEDDSNYSIEDCDVKIEEYLDSAMIAAEKIKELDSISARKYKDMHLSIYLVRRMTFAAAKKAGHTQKAKDAYAYIQEAYTEAKEMYDRANVQYLMAYRALQIMEVRQKRIKDSLESQDAKMMREERSVTVGEIKALNKSIKEHFDMVKMTASRAKNEIKYLSK